MIPSHRFDREDFDQRVMSGMLASHWCQQDTSFSCSRFRALEAGGVMAIIFLGKHG